MLSRKYRYLIALAQERHFGRAAACCHVSASTLSGAIRELEHELGVALVERGRSFVGLTAEGRTVLEYALRMASVEAEFRLHLGQLTGGATGRLRLGVIATALPVVAELSMVLRRRHAGLDLEILSLGTEAIVRGVQGFELDGGVIHTDSSGIDGMQYLPIWRERHVLIAGSATEAARRDALSWREAAHQPLCLLTLDLHNRQSIDRMFEQAGLLPRPALETNSVVSLLAHVAGGAWCSILPLSVLEAVGIPRGVKVLRLVDPELEWQTGLVTLARNPLALRVELLRDAAREIVRRSSPTAAQAAAAAAPGHRVVASARRHGTRAPA